MGIRYRPIEKKDYAAVGELLDQSFGLHRYMADAKALACLRKQYVYSCLAEATYTCVAEKEDRVIGVIMGNAKTDYRLLPHLPHLLRMVWQELQMIWFRRKEADGIRDFHQLHRIYRQLSEQHKGEFDGVLTLFAVEESCRGEGLGKALLSGLLAYLRQHGTKQIYLYTDTTCNYGFYEYQGFVRLGAHSLSLSRDGRPTQMDVFLYGYSVGS